MRKLIIILTIAISSCHFNDVQDANELCIPGYKPETSSFTERGDTIMAIPDPRYVKLLLNNFTSSNYPEAIRTADSALHIASVLLSSADFKDTISKLDFTCQNYSDYCRENCGKCSDRFSGTVVLDSVFRQKDVKLNLFLRKCRNEFGHASRNINEIYSCQPVAFFDEKDLSPAYCYAYYIAHEYMHIVGFFHTDHKDDVAEKTGWIGWEILLNWKKAEINVMALKPGEM